MERVSSEVEVLRVEGRSLVMNEGTEGEAERSQRNNTEDGFNRAWRYVIGGVVLVTDALLGCLQTANGAHCSPGARLTHRT